MQPFSHNKPGHPQVQVTVVSADQYSQL